MKCCNLTGHQKGKDKNINNISLFCSVRFDTPEEMFLRSLLILGHLYKCKNTFANHHLELDALRIDFVIKN